MSPAAAVADRAGVPPRAGIGFKPAHRDALLADPAAVGFVEVHPENYMGAGGPAHRTLAAVRERLPLSLHGVGLSIGGEEPLDRDHLARLAALVTRYAPGLVSEHLAWSSHAGVHFHELLPLPYTAATLARVVDHIDEVQDTLGRQMLIENPASHVAFDASTLSETRFLREAVEATGCGLILDVNNAFVSATNLGFEAHDYIAAFPLEAVGEIHLAGHAEAGVAAGDAADRAAGGTGRPAEDAARLLLDAHDRPVAAPVWALYADAIARIGRPVPTLIEWDHDVPEFARLAAEAARAEHTMARALAAKAA